MLNGPCLVHPLPSQGSTARTSVLRRAAGRSNEAQLPEGRGLEAYSSWSGRAPRSHGRTAGRRAPDKRASVIARVHAGPPVSLPYESAKVRFAERKYLKSLSLPRGPRKLRNLRHLRKGGTPMLPTRSLRFPAAGSHQFDALETLKHAPAPATDAQSYLHHKRVVLRRRAHITAFMYWVLHSATYAIAVTEVLRFHSVDR